MTAPTAPELVRRRQAVLALAAFTVVFFVGAITVNVVQAVHHGSGLGIGDGHPIAGQVGLQGGHGWLVDALLLGGAILADGLLVAAYAWLGARIPIESARDNAVSAEDEPWYVLEVPRLTRTLVGVGITCAVAVSVCGAILFPIILVRYGWRS